MSHICATGAQGINLIKKQDAWLLPPGQFKKLVQLLFAVPDPHVEYIVDANRNKSRFDLACRGTGKMCLATTGRSVKQNSPTRFFSKLSIELGMFKGLDDFY